MKFNKAIDESLTNPTAIKYVKQAIEALGKKASKEKIKDYIKNNIKSKSHFTSNLEFIDGAIDAIKKNQL